MRWLFFAVVLISAIFVRTASAQPLPITVDGDLIMYDSVSQVITAQGHVRTTFKHYTLFADALRYDLRSQIAVATGHVRVIDAQGRELRGKTLTYNNRAEEGILEPTEGLVDRERRVYLRGERLDFSPNRFVSHESYVTTCDPRRPLVHLTARRIEIVPEEEIVAYQASVFVGNRRLVTYPRFVVSLRPGEEGTVFPGFGVNAVDGYWVDYHVPLRLADDRGRFNVKYGTTSGIMALLTFTHKQPGFNTTLRLGRTQTTQEQRLFSGVFNLLQYDVAEIGAESKPVRIASTPFSWTLSATAGWYGERLSGQQLLDLGRAANISTSRLDGRLSVGSSRIPLAPRLTYGIQAAFRVSSYGTGNVRTITSYGADLAYQVDPFTIASLGYSRGVISGMTPLSLDVVDPADTISAGITRVVRDRYWLAFSAAHNAALSETKVAGTAALVVSPRWELSASAVYNTRLAAFEDIDYGIRYLCDCVDVIVRYRSTRGEISLEFGLLGFGERRAVTVPRSVPPFIFPEDGR